MAKKADKPAKQAAGAQSQSRRCRPTSHELLLAELSSFLHNKLAEVLRRVGLLERHMSLQDDKIAAFKASTDAQLAALGVSLDGIGSALANIAADEKAILDKLTVLPAEDLSQASQDVLASVLDDLKKVVSKSEAQAAAVQSLADSLPDGPMPTPVP